MVFLLGIYEFIGFSSFRAVHANNSAPKKFYVINLDRKPEKLKDVSLQAEKYGIQLERLEAIDGYNVALVDKYTNEIMTGQELKDETQKIVKSHSYNIYCNGDTNTEPDFMYDTTGKYRHLLTAGELGLSCSARKLWKKIAEEDQIAIIFEDDVLFHDNFDKNIKDIFMALPRMWDVVYLDVLMHDKVKNIWFKDWKTVNKTLLKVHSRNNIWGTHAYIINSKSAEKLLELYDHHSELPLDTFFSKMINDSKIHALVSKNKIADVTNSDSEISRMGRDKRYSGDN